MSVDSDRIGIGRQGQKGKQRSGGHSRGRGDRKVQLCVPVEHAVRALEGNRICMSILIVLNFLLR